MFGKKSKIGRKINRNIKHKSKEMHVPAQGISNIYLTRQKLHLAPKGKFMPVKRSYEVKPLKKGDFPRILSAYLKGTREMKVSAHKNLMKMTARDFGEDRETWKEWAVQNSEKEIIEWRADGLRDAGVNIDGLEGRELTGALIEAMMHPERAIREAVYAMLKEMHGPVKSFLPHGSENEREQFYEQWKEWHESRA
jgi:hypothetical protein